MSTPAAPPPPRANVYIDGFNLYYGCFNDHSGRAHWRQFRWLDLGTFCGKLFPDYRINRLRSFTALVNPTPNNPDCRTRQLTYRRALRTIPNLTIHDGRYATHVKKRRLADLSRRPAAVPLDPIQEVYVVEEQEKGSDVNLASYMLVDGFGKEYDVAIVVSNDSDVAAPIRLVRSELGLKVMLVNPRPTFAADRQFVRGGRRPRPDPDRASRPAAAPPPARPPARGGRPRRRPAGADDRWPAPVAGGPVVAFTCLLRQRLLTVVAQRP